PARRAPRPARHPDARLGGGARAARPRARPGVADGPGLRPGGVGLMDTLALLSAAVAVLLYPGGAYLAGAALLAGGRAAAAPARWTPPAVAAAACAVFAAALLPLPGSPATSLPGRTGPTANLLGVLLLLAAAVVLTGPPRWPARRLVLAGAATLPALVLAVAAATFSLPVLVGLPGVRLGLARDLAAAAVLVAAPLLVPDEPATTPPPARAVVLGVVVLAGMSLWVPATLPRLPGVAAAAVVLAAVALFGRLAPGLRPAVGRPAMAVGVGGLLAADGLGWIGARACACGRPRGNRCTSYTNEL